MTYEDRISIPTPEGVELELVLAGVGSRLVATLIDFIVKGVVLLALWIVGDALGGDGGGFFVALLIVGSFLVWFGYDVAFETLASGRTPGKRAAALRVVRTGRRTRRVLDLGRPQPLPSRRQPSRHLRRRRRVHPLQPPQPAPGRSRRRHPGGAGAPCSAPGGAAAGHGLRRRRPLRRLGRERHHLVRARHRPAVPGAPLAARPRRPGPPRLGARRAAAAKGGRRAPGLHPEQFLEALAEAKASRG